MGAIHHIRLSASDLETSRRFYSPLLAWAWFSGIASTAGREGGDRQTAIRQYGEGYYATFFLDPDGIKLEVTYTPE